MIDARMGSNKYNKKIVFALIGQRLFMNESVISF